MGGWFNSVARLRLPQPSLARVGTELGNKDEPIACTRVPSLLATTALRRPAKLGCSQVSSTSIFTKVLVGLGNTPKPGNRFNRPGIHHIQVWKNISLYVQVWSRLVLFGPVWSRLVLFSPVWSCKVQFGPVWSCLAPFGPILSNMVPYGSVWSYMVLYGPIWSFMAL